MAGMTDGGVGGKTAGVVGLLWAQFSAYHIDRCEAAARRLAGRKILRTVQVSTKSTVYAWEPSSSVAGAQLVTLFPGQIYEKIPKLKRLWSQYKALRGCEMACIGIAYSEPEIILLAWMLRLSGVRVIMMTASKFDDFPRGIALELIKSLMLRVYRGAIVGGRRQAEYLQFLGFDKRRLLPGYDSVGLERVHAQGLAHGNIDTPFEERNFVFVGRFVVKKNLTRLLEGFAQYVAWAGDKPRRLVLVGAGDQQQVLQQRATELGVAHLVDFPGFMPADKVAGVLASSLALMLVSVEEQWGLVVNEALAFGLPILSTTPVGANDVLSRNMLNGFVVEPDSAEGMARGLLALSSNKQDWERMVAESKARAWMADSERFADAVELFLWPEAEPAASRNAQFMDHLGMVSVRG
jgi:glycosyltransferase involved in cell wall biosynthesis